jgi:AcrR family transcriptional regulator
MINETAATTPRMRFREMMRADILNAARGILQSGVFSALSMRTLAEAVGVRAPTLYDYFASKEDVLNAIYLDAVEIIRTYFQDNLSQTKPGIARLVSMGMSYRDFAIQHPVLFQLVFTRFDPSYQPGSEQMEAASGLFQALRDAVAEAIELGEIERGDPAGIAVSLWAFVHGLAELELAGFTKKCAPASTDDVVAQAFLLMVYGMAPRGDGDPSRVTCALPAVVASSSIAAK